MQGKMARVEQQLSGHIKESRQNYAGESGFHTVLWAGPAPVHSYRCLCPVYKRQWSQQSDLLKKKIVELSRDMNNTDISKCAAQQGVLRHLLTVFSSSKGHFEAAD